MLSTASFDGPSYVGSATHLFGDAELASLLDSLTIQQKTPTRESAQSGSVHVSDVAMSDEEHYLSDASVSSTSSAGKPSSTPVPPEPCALLQSIIGLYDPAEELEDFPTTCGEYLELLFTHRELFSACPHAHTGCPAGLAQLARALELRAWRADRECDAEAVAAFRHESWQVAAWLQTGGMWWAKPAEA
ncbi:hypothetical protein PENSPDRAFT_689018 [Peniophora sp. CONT]|nr:hypothetical protein PENSPDRAFT_689018 [Peniophora sp. CONT]